MTDADSPRPATAVDQRSGKRERLVHAATELLHQQGVERTTLADIAKAADVPVGGVYYYFKTKDDVVSAVIEAHVQQITKTLAQLEAGDPAPRNRLKALINRFVSESVTIARFGCPLGSLCSELDKRDGEPGPAAELMRVPVAWAEEQFRALGRDDAHELALELMAAYEGHALLANTLRDPGILTTAADRLNRWIDTL
jgi:AcrR family transcriptional regulator